MITPLSRSRPRHTPAKFIGLFKSHGGKTYLARPILGCLPDQFDAWLEPFLGGGVITMNADVTCPVILNDLNPAIANLFRVVKDQGPSLQARLQQVDYTEENFQSWQARQRDPAVLADPVTWAACFLVVNRFSRGGLGQDFAWSERLRGGRPGDLNAWRNFVARLPQLTARLQQLNPRIHCQDGLQVIADFDRQYPRGFALLDPPYLQQTRTARQAYGPFEMSDDHHRRLLQLIRGCRCRIALCGYASALYDDTLHDWRRQTWDMANHAGQGKAKQRRTEVLWMNW